MYGIVSSVSSGGSDLHLFSVCIRVFGTFVL